MASGQCRVSHEAVVMMQLCQMFDVGDVTLNCCSQHYLWSLSSQLCQLPTGQFGKFR